MGIHPSTHYRRKRQLDHHGRRSCGPENAGYPGRANQTSMLVEQQVAALPWASWVRARPGIAAELAPPNWGEITLSTNDVAGARSPRPLD